MVGELFLEDTFCNTHFVSGRALKLNAVMITFKIRKSYQIVCIDVGNISITVQMTSKKGNKTLIVDMKDFSWNDIRSLLSGNLASDILSKLSSDTRLHLQACINMIVKCKIPAVYANISYDDSLIFYDRDNIKQCTEIDRCFLIDMLKDKVSCEPKHYIVYESIPQKIIDVVICTEDLHFWKHKGVATDFVGFALARNLQERRIVRGASTITMQLVRNLFLSHNRNLIRKLEETVLALLLENYYNIDKQTILELYINVIEFAPDVHGLYDASIFYFGKEYKLLTLIEIITLTYIIPRPKHFYEALLQDSPQLKKNLYNHINKYSYELLEKELITVGEYSTLGVELCFAIDSRVLNFKAFVEADRTYAFDSIKKMNGVHPDLVNIMQDALQTTPILFVITEGVRTTERQEKLYRQGRKVPGTIVTNCDGVKVKSFHQIRVANYGCAVDLYPYIYGQIRIHEVYVPDVCRVIALHIKSIAQKMGIPITWGGDWQINDYSHFELNSTFYSDYKYC